MDRDKSFVTKSLDYTFILYRLEELVFYKSHHFVRQLADKDSYLHVLVSTIQSIQVLSKKIILRRRIPSVLSKQNLFGVHRF